jgi:D-serine dehydratase
VTTAPVRPVPAPLDSCDKGVPGSAVAIPLADVPAQQWNVLREDLPLPVAVLKEEALRHNSRWMASFVRESDVSLAPHGKTSMSPDLFDLQLADGAWGLTLATPHQVQVARRFNYSRIFLANQLIGRSAIEYVVSELRRDPEFEFYCLVDSIENLNQLVGIARRMGLSRPINVLVEMGYRGGRAGCRTIPAGVELARAIAASAGTVALCGVEGYEAFLRGRTQAETIAAIEAFLDGVTALARQCEAEGLLSRTPVLLSAGGTSYFDIVAEKLTHAGLTQPVVVLLRSGCYVTHDSLMFTRAFALMRQRSHRVDKSGEGPRAAIEVWAYVQSRPEVQLVIAGLGKRDVSYDEGPTPLSWFRPNAAMHDPVPMPEGHTVVKLNDQHSYMTVPADSPLTIGDMIGFGVSHPCLTFDKWRVMHLVDSHYSVVGSIRTYF